MANAARLHSYPRPRVRVPQTTGAVRTRIWGRGHKTDASRTGSRIPIWKTRTVWEWIANVKSLSAILFAWNRNYKMWCACVITIETFPTISYADWYNIRALFDTIFAARFHHAIVRTVAPACFMPPFPHVSNMSALCLSDLVLQHPWGKRHMTSVIAVLRHEPQAPLWARTELITSAPFQPLRFTH